MSLTKQLNFDNQDNYQIDESLVSVTSGDLTLADLRPADATLFATWDGTTESGTPSDLNWVGSNATGSLSLVRSNNITINENDSRIDLTGTDASIVYDASNGNADHPQKGTIRVRVIPQYSGKPAEDQIFVSVNNGSDNSSLLRLLHTTAGDLKLEVYNSSGTKQIDSVLKNFDPTSKEETVFEVNYDFDNGPTQVFEDGAEIKSISTTFTRDSADLTELSLGVDPNNTTDSNFVLKAVSVFDAVQHTSDHTQTDEPQSIIYDDSNPSVEDNGTILENLTGFAETLTQEPTGSDVGYIVIVNGQAKYHDGDNWVDSDGTFSQSNTASEISSNASALVNEESTVKIEMLLKSDGFNRPKLDQVSFDFDLTALTGQTPSETEIFARLKDVLSESVALDQEPKIVVENDTFEHSGKIIASTTREFKFDSKGFVVFSLIETETISKDPMDIKLKYGTKELEFNNVQIPDKNRVNLLDIVSI